MITAPDAANEKVMNKNKVNSARRLGWSFASAVNETDDPMAKGLIDANSVWKFSHPINELNGIAELEHGFWRPLLKALPDMERRIDIFLAGEFNDRTWTAFTGHYIGMFTNDWLGLPASQQVSFLRFGEILEIQDDRIVSGHVLLDIIDFARQTGVNLVPPSLGAEFLAPAPSTQDGIRLTSSPDHESEKSRMLIEAMIAGLMQYDQKSVTSMHQEDFWHDDMLWYGPGGIGTARSLAGFQNYHQIPFLNFVPDRIGGNHVARIADGHYFATGGWPSICATTSGATWLQTELPKGAPVTMRVMDFWRRDGDLLKENWVFIDIPDVFRQCGIDVFENLSAR